jgi:tetratricopeptide (TPR) repeat protein
MLMSRSCRSYVRANVAAIVCLVASATPLQAQSDTVVVRSEPDGRERRVTGTVVEFTGASLLVRHASGREEKISPEQVVEVLGEWKGSHQAANALFAEGDFTAAEAKYREALREEDRRWVQRRVLSQLTWCYRYLGQTANAVKAFLPLYRDDPKTPYMAAIPLTWTAASVELDLERQATTWLQDKDSAAARLIGASWSVTTARRAEAIKVLREFVSDPDPRIVFLAEAQLWRTQVATSQPEGVTRWQERIERMPSAIRGGPYYVVGLALSRHETHEQAAISFMRTAILYSSQRDLVPKALLAAAQELETMDQAAEAIGLYREILTKYGNDRIAGEVEERLKGLANED